MKYNQSEGVLLDREIGPVSHWKWHSLNDPPVLQRELVDTHMLHKDPKIEKLGKALEEPPRQDDEDMLAIEFENYVKEKNRKSTNKMVPFQIKMKALKINENFSLKILDQASVYLLFRDKTTHLKLNLGMLLDDQEIVGTDTTDFGYISTGLERGSLHTESLAGLQRSIDLAQRFEKNCRERELSLRFSTIAEKCNTFLSKPWNPPLRAALSGTGDRQCCCKRKPPAFTLYYNNCLY